MISKLDAIYIYCTDFIINVANIINLSYYEVNLLLFGFIYPLSLLTLTISFFILRKRIKENSE